MKRSGGRPHANLRRLNYAAGDRRLEIFEVTWSPLVQAFKQDLLLTFEKQHAAERALPCGHHRRAG